MESITLTGQEIVHLAQYAGFTVAWTKDLTPDELEAEYTIYHRPKTPITDDDSLVEYYNHFATCDGGDFNECMPLGSPIGNGDE